MLDLGILLLRLVIGLYVAAHGAQKLLGWFGGTGLEATITTMGSRLGFRPVRLWITSLAAAEAFGGLLMAVGLLGSLGPLAVAGAMLGAAVFGHGSKGPWGSRGGYELAATNLAVALGVALIGVGRFSLDALLGLAVPQTVSLAFGILVLLGLLTAGLTRRSQPAPS